MKIVQMPNLNAVMVAVFGIATLAVSEQPYDNIVYGLFFFFGLIWSWREIYSGTNVIRNVMGILAFAAIIASLYLR